MLKHVEMQQAQDILAALPAAPKTEEIPLDAALDRVLAEDVYASFPMPPFPKSPFDGFAFRAADVPGTLRIEGEIPAGPLHLPPLEPGTAVRIFTGAPVPPEADAVVKFEHTSIDGNTVAIDRAFRHDQNVIQPGEDYEAGTLLVSAGVRLTPPRLGMLASQGLAGVKVFKRPTAAILSTGSELAGVGEARPPYGIYNSSLYAISGYLRRMGFEVVSAGTVADDNEEIRDRTAVLMASRADLVLTTGGASVGDYDFALSSAEAIGAEVLFWKVNMKPGGALLAAVKDGKPLLSLSGNPAAALMSLLLTAQPLLRKLCGQTPEMETIRLPLAEEQSKTRTSARVLRGDISFGERGAVFVENRGRGNGNIASFIRCGALGILPPNQGPFPAGTEITALPLPGDLL